MPTYMHECIHTGTNCSIIYIQTHMYTYTHACIHIHMHAYIQGHEKKLPYIDKTLHKNELFEDDDELNDIEDGLQDSSSDE
jgi:hypothetical protein